MAEITLKEVAKALQTLKSGKAVGPDDVPVDVWKWLGHLGIEILTHQFNRIDSEDHNHTNARGDIQDFGNCRGIKLILHTMKIWEIRVTDQRLRKEVTIS